MPKLTLFSKPGCHLCDLAKEVLARARRQAEFQLEEVDISTSAKLLEKYGHDIPVILLDGVEIARHFVRERDLLKLVNKS